MSHRFIVAALAIDRERLGDRESIKKAKRWSRHRWQVPIIDKSELDMNELRGRLVSNVKFGQFSHQLHIWVDGNGRKRHPI